MGVVIIWKYAVDGSPEPEDAHGIPPQSIPGNHGISISNGSDIYYQFYLDGSNYLRAGLGDEYSFINNRFYNRYPLTENIFHLRLIVKGARIAFYVNQEPLLFFKNEDFRLYQGDSEKLVALFSNANDTPSDPDPIGAAFSNFKVWNLTHIEVP